MTERVKHITVVVSENMREDDAVPLISAISLLKGVISVGFDVQDIDAHVAQSRARNEISGQILAILFPEG